MSNDWDKVRYHGRYNRWPFTEVVSFVLGRYGSRSAGERAGTRILDLGCGGAHHLLFLAAEGFDYSGVDGSSESVAIAQDRLRENGFDPSPIVRAPLDKLPWDDGTFEVVLDRGSLTCNRKSDLPPLYKEIHRVLAPGGMLFSAMLHVDSTSRTTGRDLGDGDTDQLGGRLEDAGVVHYTTVDEQRSLLAEFAEVTVETQVRRVELGEPAGMVTAWALSTCRK